MMSLFSLKSVGRYLFNSLITSRNAEWVHLGSRRRQLDARRDRPPEDISNLYSSPRVRLSFHALYLSKPRLSERNAHI